MKKLAALLFAFIFCLFTVSISSAQNITPEPALNGDSSITYTATPPDANGDTGLAGINGNTQTVNIKFNELAGEQFFVCLKGTACLPDKNSGIELEDEITIGAEGINVCADGAENLKLADSEGTSQCGDKDWFHEGKVYRLTLYRDNEMEVKEAEATFYINHFYPTITVAPQSPNFDTPIEITLNGTRRPPNKGDNNNYQIVVEGTSGYKQIKCVTVKPNAPATVRFDIDGRGLATGSYMVKVNERVGDGRPLGLDRNCEGGFTYWHVPFTVTANGGEVGEPQQDPKRSDYKSFNEFLNKLNGSEGKVTLPCGLQENTGDPENKKCLRVNTAIGNVPTDPIGFIARLFSLVLSIAGAGALILIIYSGYRLLISRGNPEMIKGARETLTSAILGLLFIVFSLVILSVIAGNVLKIPGFG